MVNEEWNPVIIAAFSSPVLVVIVALMPAVVRAWLKKCRR